MSQLLKHYSVNRDNPQEYATSPEQFSRYRFGTIMPDISGLTVVHTLADSNNITFFLSTCPDDVVIEERTGIEIITQQEWDTEIANYDSVQESKRYDILRKHRNKLLEMSDWFVTKSLETNTTLSDDFKTWRQNLRDLPASNTFPSSIPECPESIGIDQSSYTNYVGEVKSVPMINDPLPPVENQPEIVFVENTQESIEITEETVSVELPLNTEETLVRARNEDGTFVADDPSTPDIDEAWVDPNAGQ